jgi:hypothetical protein
MLTELHSRKSCGIEVSLWADILTSECEIRVSSDAENFKFQVPAKLALDAFNHPYVYAAAQLNGKTAP